MWAFSISIHILGLIFWGGTLLSVTKLMRGLCAEGVPPEIVAPNAAILKRTFFSLGLAGLVLTTLSGLYQFFFRGFDFYMKQTHWFHGKLTCIIVLYVVTAIIGLQLVRAGRGKNLKSSTCAGLHGATSAVLLIIIFLTIFSTRS